MKIRRIKRKDWNKAADLLANEFVDDPSFKYYTKEKGKKHFNIVKLLISLDMKSFAGSHMILKGIYLKNKLIAVGFLGKNRFSLRFYLKSLKQIIAKANFSVLFRLIKAGYHTKYNIFPKSSYYLAEIAVKKEYQGKGYGTRLMEEFYRISHKKRMGIGLITDKEVNIPFYKKNNYRLIHKNTVAGIKKYYFFRQAQSQ